MDKNELNREYELSYVVIVPEAEGEVLDVLKKVGASVSYTRPASQIRLGYPIKKNETAFFGFCYFTLDPALVQGVSKTLEGHENVLRFLVVSPPIQASSRPSYKARSPREATPSGEQTASEGRSETGLSNELLERKIEEILK